MELPIFTTSPPKKMLTPSRNGNREVDSQDPTINSSPQKRSKASRFGLRRGCRDRKGASLVEMAMVLPVVVLVLFSAVEFARVMMVRQALTNAVREGCRDACLVTTQDSSTSEALIRDRLRKVIINPDNTELLRISVTPSFTTGLDTLTTVTAEVEVDCDDISWFPLMVFSNAKLRATSKMVRE